MPRLDFWFRLFHHASLGLASVCLLYAEAFFLPTPLLLGLYLLAGLQVLAFGADGRRWVLPGWAANLLAGAVAGGGAAWIVVELNAPDMDLVLGEVGYAAMLPYIGPVLIGLLVIKLFRPRTPRDFWLLQGVGALQVVLACVLASTDAGLLFGVLLVAYFAFALGCLALHYFQEEQQRAKKPAAEDRLPFAGRLAPFCLRWTLAAAAVAAPLFLLTPRIEGTNWNALKLTGAGTGAKPPGFSQAMDLNAAGPVRLGGEEVFRVAVVASPGQAPPVLPADLHWRGGVLDSYALGVWNNAGVMRRQQEAGARRDPLSVAPAPGPGTYRLDFTVGPNGEGFFLAEPVRTDGAPDRWTLVDMVDRAPGREKLTPIAVSGRGLVLTVLYDNTREYHYRQTVFADADPERAPAGKDEAPNPDPLVQQGVKGLADWTADLLKRLAADPGYGLTPADLQRIAPPPLPPGSGPKSPGPGGSTGTMPLSPGLPPPAPVAALPQQSWERVGRALTTYLARSGDYGYTLDLRRQDRDLDPVMDFLVNVKEGHCARFASALALMLRSQGVPARLVNGFRGAQERSADGAYLVRANQAHAWVEIRVPPRAPAPDAAQPAQWEWVTLDPTPASEATPPAPYSLWDWWQNGQETGDKLWGGLVIQYGAKEQANLWAALQSPEVLKALAGFGLGLPALAGVVGLTYVGLRRMRRARGAGSKRAAPAAAGYGRLLALLARHGGPRPATGQTPREFAADARRFLLGLPAAAPFADLPDDMVDRLYRVLFGGQAEVPAETAGVEARLGQLAAALRAARP